MRRSIDSRMLSSVDPVTRAENSGDSPSSSSSNLTFKFSPLPYLSSKQTDTDLKAFERRLTEVITCLRPATIRWRIILVIASICTAIGAWQWINDPLTSRISFIDSLFNHLFFSMSSLALVFNTLKMKAQLESSRHLVGIRSSDKIHKSKHKEEENEEIKAYLTKLQEIVPFMPKHKKLSKLEVITYVIDYIRDLRMTLGLPANTARVPFIPSLDDMDSSSSSLDSSSNSSSPSSPQYNLGTPHSNNNNILSSINLQLQTIRQPLTIISGTNNSSLSPTSCSSSSHHHLHEVPQLVDKSSSSDLETRPVSC